MWRFCVLATPLPGAMSAPADPLPQGGLVAGGHNWPDKRLPRYATVWFDGAMILAERSGPIAPDDRLVTRLSHAKPHTRHDHRRRPMTPNNRFFCSAVLCLVGAPAFGQDTFLVTNFDATGDGSLQAALDAAAATPDRSTIIVTEAFGRIETDTGLTYAGAPHLTVIGNNVTVASAQNVTLFSVAEAEVITLSSMTFEGPGGWSIEARGDLDGPAGKGLFFDVADDATDAFRLRLSDISVRGVAGHGIHISDCTLADACGSGDGDAGGGSAAGVSVRLDSVTIEDVGQGSFDADGLRVDERGPGSIFVSGMYVTLQEVGADGIELDEGQDGDVMVDLLSADFFYNGNYCNPAALTPFLPAAVEGEFDEGAMAADAIPARIEGSPDDACFEREVALYDSGTVESYAFSIDVDDGLDIDEAGPGSIEGQITRGFMEGNFDEGYDFDEAGPGNIEVVFNAIFAGGNVDDALKMSETGAGNVMLSIYGSEFISNGGVGIVVEEEGPGDLMTVLVVTATVGNDGGNLGVDVVQDDDGTGEVYVIDSEIADRIETDGARLDAD